MATIPREFFDFLKTVDGEVERPEVFLRQCAGAFMANSATDQFDLIGFDMVDCKRGVSICGCTAWLLMSFSFLSGSVPDAGVGAFMRRAISKANERCASAVLSCLGKCANLFVQVGAGLGG